LVEQYFHALAAKFPATKFLKSISSVCIPNYPDKNLPTLFVYCDGELRKQFIGPDELRGLKLTQDGQNNNAHVLFVRGGRERRERGKEQATVQFIGADELRELKLTRDYGQYLFNNAHLLVEEKGNGKGRKGEGNREQWERIVSYGQYNVTL